MNQTPQNIVRLESNRSVLGFAFAILLLVTGITVAGSLFFLWYAITKGPEFWVPIVIGVGFASFTSLLVTLDYKIIRKIRVPDVLEFSREQFRYASAADHHEFSAPWSEVGPPEVRKGGRSSYVYVEVAGTPHKFGGDLFGVSLDTLFGMINSAQEGNITTKADWQEPDRKNSPLIGFCFGLAVAALAVAFICTPLLRR